MKLPKVRNRDLLIQELSNELLIFDLQINKAFALNETATKVFTACGLNQTFEELQFTHQMNDDLIYLTLDELNKHHLLVGEYKSIFSGVSRREAIRKVGLSTMIALPFIASIIAPNATNAQSGGGGGLPLQAACTNNDQCASGICMAASPQTCCSGGDGAPCTVGADCCLVGSGCRANNTCCRGAGRGAGTNISSDPTLCCSGTCVNSGSLCVCT